MTKSPLPKITIYRLIYLSTSYCYGSDAFPQTTLVALPVTRSSLNHRTLPSLPSHMRHMAFSRPIATLLQTHFGGRPTLLPGRCARLLVPASSQLYSTFVDKRLYLETHPDEKNIENPYNVGATFLATSHNPSSNTCRAFPRPTDHLRERIRTRHPAELCLEYLPDPGTPGDRQLHLTITEQLQVGECENSQVVTARPLAVQGQPLPFNVARDAVVAAKFYDPAVQRSYPHRCLEIRRLFLQKRNSGVSAAGPAARHCRPSLLRLLHRRHTRAPGRPPAPPRPAAAGPAGPVRIHQRHTAVISRGPSFQHEAAPGHCAKSPQLVQQDAPARRVPPRLSPRQHSCAIRRRRSRG